jgi:hypothetical protein
MGTGHSFPGLKRLGREVDHSPPSDAEVKNGVALHYLITGLALPFYIFTVPFTSA